MITIVCIIFAALGIVCIAMGLTSILFDDRPVFVVALGCGVLSLIIAGIIGTTNRSSEEKPTIDCQCQCMEVNK